MNPLDRYPVAREYLYMLQWIVNLIMGAIAIVLTILEQSPLWYIITTAVLNFVWSYLFRTAQTNVNTGADNG